MWCREENLSKIGSSTALARGASGGAPVRFVNPYGSTAACRFFCPLTPSCSSSIRAFCGERSSPVTALAST